MTDGKWQKRFQTKKDFEKWFSGNDYLLNAPGTLLGDEMNSFRFDWEEAFEDGTLEDRFRIALADVNASAEASCSVAVKLFYQELHEYDNSWIVERLLCPADEHNDLILKEKGFSYLSLEGRMPPSAFNVICCSQQMIGDEVNLIGMLLDSGIPVMSRDRTERDPIIIRGGASSFNPSVIMDVCDLFFIGEGEGTLAELLRMIQKGLADGLSREEILLAAVKTWDCLWAPRFYEQRFDETGKLLGMAALRPDVPEKIKYRYVEDLDDCFATTKPVGNYCYPSSASCGVEITKGCEGQCGFCVSGFTYMPFRARSVDCVVRNAKEYLYNSGAKFAVLRSFSGMSYPYLNELAVHLDDEIGGYAATTSVRMDSVHEDPEYCSLLHRQGKERIVFGVEGISQRLRQMTSKNCSEEQILETVRMLCRNGYKKIKFMFIFGLPGESDEDREELVRLTEKIMQIRSEEAKEGVDPPVFLYSWTPLKIFPFTPFQWFEARPQTGTLPEDTRARLQDMGVIINSDETKELYELTLTQLINRGDRRLQDMLIGMAEAGIRRHGFFDRRAQEFADRWIGEHDVPGYDEWFAARDRDEVLPWDFIDNGVSRDHLWKRYLSASGSDPEDFPRCLDRCQGCGACSKERHEVMAGYRREKKQDRQISLGSIDPQIPAGQEEDRQLRFTVLSFTTDDRYRVVSRLYWRDELRRTLDHAGIRFERNRVHVFKPYHERYDWATGLKLAYVGIKDDVPDDKLLKDLNAHSIHMRFTDVKKMDHAPELSSVSYVIPCPEGTDMEALGRRIKEIMDSGSWHVRMEYVKSRSVKSVDADIRDEIMSLELRDREISMKIGPVLPPYTVYQALLGIPWETAGRYKPVCTEVEYD